MGTPTVPRTSERVSPLLEWLRGTAVGAVLHYRVLADPKPRNTPRVTRYGGIFYSKGYEAFYVECQKQLAEQAGGALLGPIGAVIEVIIKRPKMGKLADPLGDVDNYAKGALDAATKGSVWGDDGQIVSLAVTKRYAEGGEAPGVNLWVGQVA